VGASNTRQGIGATVTNEDKNETTVKDSTVGTIDSSKGTAQKAQNIETGSITADRIIVKNNDPLDQVWSFIAGGGLMLIGLGAVIWALLRHRKDRAAEKDNG
jgi:F0F1-type ATP synthase assembly protein I